MNNKNAINKPVNAIEPDMVDYLLSLGYTPAKIRHNDYWFISPFRNEQTPSFKVNRKLNLWYDFGMGKGGNYFSFAAQFNTGSNGSILKNRAADLAFSNSSLSKPLNSSDSEDFSIKIISVKPIQSLALMHYLTVRRIPFTIAAKYCVEIRYEVNGKTYFSIGFKNDSGGYELRNTYCKNSSSPKDISTYKNGANKLAVFEGFFDFLSFLYLLPDQQKFEWDFCVLNSLSFTKKLPSFLDSYQAIHLFLDNDLAGQNCCTTLLKLDGRFKDESKFYINYKDLNEWLLLMGKRPP